MLEPAKQSWFDRFRLNPGEVPKKKKMCTHVCYVCVWSSVSKKVNPIVLARQSGVRCAVSQLTWPGLCVHVSAQSG